VESDHATFPVRITAIGCHERDVASAITVRHGEVGLLCDMSGGTRRESRRAEMRLLQSSDSLEM
jgi:hypothetical protein